MSVTAATTAIHPKDRTGLERFVQLTTLTADNSHKYNLECEHLSSAKDTTQSIRQYVELKSYVFVCVIVHGASAGTTNQPTHLHDAGRRITDRNYTHSREVIARRHLK